MGSLPLRKYYERGDIIQERAYQHSTPQSVDRHVQSVSKTCLSNGGHTAPVKGVRSGDRLVRERNLFGGKRLAREIVATGVETSLHEARVETQEVLHLNGVMSGGVSESNNFPYLFLFDDLCHVGLLRSVEL